MLSNLEERAEEVGGAGYPWVPVIRSAKECSGGLGAGYP